MGLAEGSCSCGSSGGLLWVRDEGVALVQFQMELAGFVFLPQVDQSCSLGLISTCICMCQYELDFFCLLIQSEPSFTPHYTYRHLTDISQSKFVRHSPAALELPCLVSYWIRRRNERLLKASKQGDLLKGIFIIDSRERTGQFIHSLQLQAYS